MQNFKGYAIILMNLTVGIKMSKTIEMLKTYIPYNEQEQKDVQFFIDCENIEQILTRENERCHLCSSAFIINKSHDKVLCIYHNIYDSWTWVGGHADGDDDMLYVAKKETKEETSLEHCWPILDTPIAVDSLPVAGHVKRGKYVPAHIHLSIAYLFEADENEFIQIKADENSGVGWFTPEEMFNAVSEKWMAENIYKKLCERSL